MWKNKKTPIANASYQLTLACTLTDIKLSEKTYGSVLSMNYIILLNTSQGLLD